MTVADLAGGRAGPVGDPGNGLVLVWSPPAAGLSPAGVAALGADLEDGLTRAVPLIASGPDRVVNLVVAADPGPLAAAHAATVAGWGRGLARELARRGATVNTVLAPAGRPREDAVALASFLAGPEAGFVTGQTLGHLPASPPAPGHAAAGAEEAAAVQRSPGPATSAQPRGPATGVPAPDRERWALVSGGSGDLGSAICRRLLAAGWSVVIGHRAGTDPVPARFGADSRRIATVPLDLLDGASVGAAIDRLPALVGRLGGVVLNAGWTDTAAFVDSGAAARRAVLGTNLTGAAHLLASLGDLLAPGAVVVGTGSEAGRIGEAGRAVYSGAKAGLAALLSALDGDGWRAVTTAPGPYDTALLRQTWGDPGRAEEGIERLRRLVPLRRLGHPDELAAAVAFAMSPAGGALGGQTLSVGGGITMV